MSPVFAELLLPELLYARDQVNPRRPASAILPNADRENSPIEFRWIHLPALSTNWIETLLTKLFIEEGASDVVGFQQLEKSFSHQHRGKETHSRYMRPTCQLTTRSNREDIGHTATTDLALENGLSAPTDSATATPLHRLFTQESKPSTKNGLRQESLKGQRVPNESQKIPKRGKRTRTDKGAISAKSQEARPRNGVVSSIHGFQPQTIDRIPVTNNVFMFFPYLHFENIVNISELKEAVKRAEQYPQGVPLKSCTADERLIRAHLGSSSVSLHIRRTLDQSFYHNIDTSSRDYDQVVYRYQWHNRSEEGATFDPKIYMVDQCWMYILDDIIITAFPQRWQQPKNDPLNVLDNIIEDINSRTRPQAKSVYEVATRITARCVGLFDRHHDDFQFLDWFDSAIGNATDKESELFKTFNTASRQASQWIQRRQKHGIYRRMLAPLDQQPPAVMTYEQEDLVDVPVFVDKLLDIGQETDLLAEVKDQRDELSMIRKVLEDQAQVLPSFESALGEVYMAQKKPQADMKKKLREQLRMVEMHIKDIDRMDKQAKRIYDSVTDMLDLKQKHANAFEARFARDQAKDTYRQTQTVMVFTVVTIVFLPLSFIAAFFTINIREFPGSNANVNADSTVAPGLPLSYVSAYTFGIGFAISFPLIFIALKLEDISLVYDMLKKQIADIRLKRRLNMGERADGTDDFRRSVLGHDHTAERVAPYRSSSSDEVWAINIEADRIRIEPVQSRDSSTDVSPQIAPKTTQHTIIEKTMGFRMLRTSNEVPRGLLG